jgi:hypothetical protein
VGHGGEETGATRFNLFVARGDPPWLYGCEPLRLLRAAWVDLAILIFGLDAAGIPYTHSRYESVCTGAEQ